MCVLPVHMCVRMCVGVHRGSPQKVWPIISCAAVCVFCIEVAYIHMDCWVLLRDTMEGFHCTLHMAHTHNRDCSVCVCLCKSVCVVTPKNMDGSAVWFY